MSKVIHKKIDCLPEHLEILEIAEEFTKKVKNILNRTDDITISIAYFRDDTLFASCSFFDSIYINMDKFPDNRVEVARAEIIEETENETTDNE